MSGWKTQANRNGFARNFQRGGGRGGKDVVAYRALIVTARLDPAYSFMIGNSPRSDINPAIAAGLRAVFIPHPHTWELEHEEINSGDERIVTIAGFVRLLELF